MTDLLLRDILINARQEAARMNHHYIGVEHLVIGALSLRGGIIATLVEQLGYKPEYLIDAIRRHSGKGSRQRLWAGVPNSPRAQVVLSIAEDFRLEEGRDEISERDLLLAALDEGDSIPTRVLTRMGIDLAALREAIVSFSSTQPAPLPYVRVEFGPQYASDLPLSEEHLFVLRRMFYGYDCVRVERRLLGGYSKALLLAVKPIQADGSEDAPVVVKIDRADDVLDEARRYETQIKATLPPLTARLEERPTAPETSELAGLKYTFVTRMDRPPQDMRTAAWEMGLAQFGSWLRHELYPYFGQAWWEQRRPYRFQAWQEYDFLLPPLLVLDVLPPDEQPGDDDHLLRDPVRRERLAAIDLGDRVAVSGFSVHRVHEESKALQLIIGSGGEAARRAQRVLVRGIDFSRVTHYRGEVIERLAGRVYATRADLLLNALRSLEPDFELTSKTIPAFAPLDMLPNPLRMVDVLLDRAVHGTVSRLHGDLHLGNILRGPNNSGFLIDFAQARSGHTLFDWATMEVSLLNDLTFKSFRGTWNDARRVISRLSALSSGVPANPDPQLDDVLAPVEALREIVAHCLAQPGAWDEYWMALFFCSLRALGWETMTVGGRRLMFLLAAYCASRLSADNQVNPHTSAAETDYSDASGRGS